MKKTIIKVLRTIIFTLLSAGLGFVATCVPFKFFNHLSDRNMMIVFTCILFISILLTSTYGISKYIKSKKQQEIISRKKYEQDRIIRRLYKLNEIEKELEEMHVAA